MLTKKVRHYNDSNLSDVIKCFNDGVCEIYRSKERQLIAKKGKFYFSDESVGLGHYWEARNNNVSIDRAIGISANDLISPMDVVKIGNEYYRVAMIQYKNNLSPHWMKLNLERSVFAYEDATESV